MSKTCFSSTPVVDLGSGVIAPLIPVVGTPSDGDVVTYVGANSRYEPVAGGGGGYTDEQAQDAVGAMVDGSTLEYVDATPLLRVKDDGITFAKMQNIATARILGRDTSGSGDIEELTASEVLTMLGTPSGPATPPGYLESFDAIADPNNDNFSAGSLDTGGTRFSGANGWTWLNQGTATATLDSGRLWLRSPSSATLQIRGIYVPLPSAPWCYRMTVQFQDEDADFDQSNVGMFLRDSVGGGLETFGIGYSGGNRIVWTAKWTNATTFTSSRGFPSVGTYHPSFLEIECDGTNYYLRVGFQDGVMQQWGEFGVTSHLANAANQIGVFSENDQSSPTSLVCREFYRVPVSVHL